jgi:acyl-CoA thioester hydrolase
MKELVLYEHQTQYYETDQMGIIHHSNYIRWFEEARMDYMGKLGLAYHVMEEEGVSIPVLSVSCQYKSMTHFGECVTIQIKVAGYNGIRMSLEYEVRDKVTQIIRCTGKSEHCFLNKKGQPVSIKKNYASWHRLFQCV